MSSRSTALANVLFGEFLASVAWFPIWWYSVGLRRMTDHALNALRYRAESFGFRLWLKNFFVPMYGQHDITGRLVSVFMRLVVLIGRGIFFIVESLVYAVGLLFWMLIPFLFAMFAILNIVGATV